MKIERADRFRIDRSFKGVAATSLSSAEINCGFWIRLRYQLWWLFFKPIEVCRLVGKARIFTRFPVVILSATWKIAMKRNVVFYDSIRGTKWVTGAGMVKAFCLLGQPIKTQDSFHLARGAGYKKEKYCTHQNAEKVVAIRCLNKWQSIIESKE